MNPLVVAFSGKSANRFEITFCLVSRWSCAMKASLRSSTSVPQVTESNTSVVFELASLREKKNCEHK